MSGNRYLTGHGNRSFKNSNLNNGEIYPEFIYNTLLAAVQSSSANVTNALLYLNSAID